MKRFVALAAYLLSNAASAAAWTASVDQGQGLPALSRGGASALSSTFMFWGKNWRHILISLGARSVPKSASELPFYSEPVEGQLMVKAPKGLKLYKRAMPAGEMRQIAAPYIDGRYRSAWTSRWVPIGCF